METKFKEGQVLICKDTGEKVTVVHGNDGPGLRLANGMIRLQWSDEVYGDYTFLQIADGFLVDGNECGAVAPRVEPPAMGSGDGFESRPASQHTPGPWRQHCPYGGTIYIDARIGGSTLQEVASCGPTQAPGQQEANGRLIAAAPDLLEAVKALIEGYENTEHTGLMDMQVCGSDIIKARAAIAKATGEAV